MTAVPLVDLAPSARVALVGAVLAVLVLGWAAWRQRGATPSARLRAITALTLFLTFDLVVFGAYTRLSDSGLGCPDRPGCYGHGSPVGAAAPIASAESADPSGPVTHHKAWVEMVHRYLATGVGGLIAVLAVANVWRRVRGRRPSAAGWAVASLAWVALQGAFGAWTVTWKLYPAIVTAHLLGGMALLALLAVQNERQALRRLALPDGLRRGVAACAVLVFAQVALGGWTSSNEAVLACLDVPTCQGAWWPPMDAANGYALAHPLGRTAAGGDFTLAALTAIHVGHRVGAVVVLLAVGLLCWRLARWSAAGRRWAALLGGLLLLQVGNGVANVVGGWPLAGALLHTAGAAALVTAIAALLARGWARGEVGLSAMPAAAFTSSRGAGWQRPAAKSGSQDRRVLE